eukprot:jgi/Botrbrau1/6957/Bobra.0215s0034.1
MQGCVLKSSPPLENEFDPSDQKSSGDIELGINLGAAFIPPGDSKIQNYKLNWIQLRPIKSMTEAGGVPRGLSITMKDVGYTVRSHRTGKRKSISYGMFQGGFLLENGSVTGTKWDGKKKTLLDLLAGRKTAGHQMGDIRFGGARPSSHFLRRYYWDTLSNLTP